MHGMSAEIVELKSFGFLIAFVQC